MQINPSATRSNRWRAVVVAVLTLDQEVLGSIHAASKTFS